MLLLLNDFSCNIGPQYEDDTNWVVGKPLSVSGRQSVVGLGVKLHMVAHEVTFNQRQQSVSYGSTV